ncbi:hypothetical protein QBC38DRAFT_184697 [Podospora fimiseda]|uniref:SMP-30/Gluconolactonase/LRE-like region domain-containing protein n=1 Tax=Podospora fimiseda TaxID=252190 RepID=A0AAN7BQG3_9PEZI|nr:hypothetical protein QBC38DRAFT_184697 [Podospora fimiseda]
MATPNYEIITVHQPYLNLHSKLGEGPHHEPSSSSLRFVDIISKKLHTVSLTNPEDITTLDFPEAVTVTADIEGIDPKEKILVGVKGGIAVLDRESGKYEYLSRFEEAGHEGGYEVGRVRSNDGAVQPGGKGFWLGSMTDFGLGEFRDEGHLYQFTPNSPPTIILSDLKIPNSVGWSPDNKTMYFTHSTERKVIAWDYDAENGTLSNKRVWYKHEGPGEPDGFRVDVEGNIWHAVYGESRVLKINKEGKLVGEIRLPTRNITCVEFVGEELFITTANDDEGEGESKELGGALFRVNVGVKGVGFDKYKLE